MRWHLADGRRFEPPAAAFDLIVTNFWLDCFPAADLAVMVPRLVGGLAPCGRWLVGDFALPSGGLVRRADRPRARVAGMYAVFRLTTRIPAGRLADPATGVRQDSKSCARSGGSAGS